MPLYLYTSNRLEHLASAFAALTEAAPLPPLEPETVVLQSGGMARWLNMQLAERLGVSANIVFPFPNGFVDTVFRQVLPAAASAKLLDKRVLQWQLMRVLPELLDRPEFAVLGDYLVRGRALKKYQLAGRLTDLFDQYLIFRPEMILAWEAGQGDSWQALLWRELSRRADCLAGVANRAQLQSRCLEALARSELPDAGLPSRVAVFGLSAIPPYYLRIFTALAEHLDVHFYFLNPCREYWGDIVSERTMDRLSRNNASGEDLYLTQGNPLLASTGQQGRELLSMLLECNVAGEQELFAGPDPGAGGSGTSLLAAVQGDILALRDGTPRPGETLADHDRSIMVHSCHGPMRELEVLHDQLLALFENLPGLEPKDIIVMTPDIETYSPLIGAVFGSRKVLDGRPLPFSIADRSIKKEGVLFGTFLTVLGLVGSRMEISRVLAVLEREPVRCRFAVSLDELELIEKWLGAVNIRWGIDDSDRHRLGLPATVENTWRFGLDRLLLGYAMVGGNRHDFAGILPYDDLEGGEVAVLGRFLDFTDKLFDYARRLAGQRDLAGWSDLLLALFNDLLAVGEGQEQEWEFIGRTIAGLRKMQGDAAFSAEVEFEVVLAELEKAGRSDSLTSGFMAGGITFCEMLPMRAVPFKVVCLLGMNDGAYPRPSTVPSFDLIAANPRLGDRSRRKDDRYLFLESILSARQCFYLSFVGQSIRDGSPLAPSVLVSELVEYLMNRFTVGRQRILTTHPLQPFSPAYFTGRPELFSFSASNFAAAQMLGQARKGRMLISAPLPPPPAEFREITLAELSYFFGNPVRYFCRKRLGIHLEGEVAELAGTENFNLDFLERYQLGEIMLQDRLAGKPAPDHFRIARQQGVLPHGSVARAAFSELAEGVAVVADKLATKGGAGELLTLTGGIALDSFTISGQLETSPASGLIIYRYARLKPVDLVRGWLNHLVLDRLAPADWARTTHVVGNDKIVSFPPVADSDALLAAVLGLYWQGLMSPLRFFPAASLAFARAKRKKMPEAAAMVKARSKWRGDDFARGEAEDRYHRLCFRNIEPLNQEFRDNALTFFGPLDECGGGL
jgi:exodeoxyribonuclease V gamma subunit